MPSDLGRSWDDLVRRHWNSLWAKGRPAEEARAALRSFFASVHEELSRQRRLIDEIRKPSVAAPAAPPKPLTPPKPITPPKPAAVAAAVLDPKQRERAERALEYRFRNPRLLEEALAHPSFTHENPELPLASNYRLAFLGDALLGFLVADALHTAKPEADQQVLTEMRKRLVSRPALGRTAARLGLDAFLLLGRGQEKEGRKSPTILAETFEAIVAAIYLDGGPDAAKSFVLRVLGGELPTPSGPRAAASAGRPRARRR